jgi:hypothetical protein
VSTSLTPGAEPIAFAPGTRPGDVPDGELGLVLWALDHGVATLAHPNAVQLRSVWGDRRLCRQGARVLSDGSVVRVTFVSEGYPGDLIGTTWNQERGTCFDGWEDFRAQDPASVLRLDSSDATEEDNAAFRAMRQRLYDGIAPRELRRDTRHASTRVAALASWAAVHWLDSKGQTTGLKDPAAATVTPGPLDPEGSGTRCYASQGRDGSSYVTSLFVLSPKRGVGLLWGWPSDTCDKGWEAALRADAEAKGLDLHVMWRGSSDCARLGSDWCGNVEQYWSEIPEDERAG